MQSADGRSDGRADGRTDGRVESWRARTGSTDGRCSLQEMDLHQMDSSQLLVAWRSARADSNKELADEVLAEMETACTEENLMYSQL